MSLACRYTFDTNTCLITTHLCLHLHFHPHETLFTHTKEESFDRATYRTGSAIYSEMKLVYIWALTELQYGGKLHCNMTVTIKLFWVYTANIHFSRHKFICILRFSQICEGVPFHGTSKKKYMQHLMPQASTRYT